MNTYNDIRTRFQIALNEDYKKAVERIANNVDTIGSMEPSHQKIVTDEINTAADYIEKFGPINTIKTYFIETKGFSEGDWKSIESLLKKESEESLNALNDYINKPLSIDYFVGKTSKTNIVKDLSSTTGISSSFLGAIFGMAGQTKSGKGVGKGELFLGLLVDGATNASVGDVNVNGQAYEVKGRDARLNTQNGFGTGMQAINSFFDSLSKVDKKLADEFGSKDKKNIQQYNFLKGGNSKFYELFKTWVAKGYKLDDIINLVADTVFCGPSGIWFNGGKPMASRIVDAFKKNLNADGSSLNDEMLQYELQYINILYYKAQEHFNGIFLINDKTGDFAYFNPDKQDAKWLSNNVKYTQPSWQDKPTSDCYKITLK